MKPCWKVYCIDCKARKKWLLGITRTWPGSKEKPLSQHKILLPKVIKEKRKEKQLQDITQEFRGLQEFSSQIYSCRNPNQQKSLQCTLVFIINLVISWEYYWVAKNWYKLVQICLCSWAGYNRCVHAIAISVCAS